MKYTGIIVAAGQSSRMGDFKPLMELNGFKMAEMAVDSLRSGGADEIIMVLGRQADDMLPLAEALGAKTVINENYASTDMLCSVKLGIEMVEDSDAVFVLPVDSPLASPSTVGILKSAINSGAACCIPLCFDKEAHPPLISRSCFETILNFDGDGGLRGALSQIKGEVKMCEVGDEGALLDADTPDDLESMRDYAIRHRGISRELCRKFWDEFSLEPKIRAHCEAVAVLSGYIAKKLIGFGYCLDIRLIESASLLHDMCRTQPNHAQAAADVLRARGYDGIADLIVGHMRLDDGFFPCLDEGMIVFLADKMAKRDKFITIEERYEASLSKYPDPVAAWPYVQQQMRRCLTIKDLYEEVTNDDLYEQCGKLLPKA